MRTRSSRFFVILLHLLGVSNHYPSTPSAIYDWAKTATTSGIVGVHPYSIVLERIDLQEVGGLDGIEWFHHDPSSSRGSSNRFRRKLNPVKEQQESSQPNNHATNSSSSSSSSEEDNNLVVVQQQEEPFWLQDSIDGKCLGPSGGFSECGDATLWFIQRRDRTLKQRKRMGLFTTMEEEDDDHEPYGYAFKLADMNFEKLSREQQQQQQHPQDSQESTIIDRLRRWAARMAVGGGGGAGEATQETITQDCLVPSTSVPLSPKQKRSSTTPTPPTPLSLRSCSSAKEDAAWSWRVDEQGILYQFNDNVANNNKDNNRCLWRFDENKAVLDDCNEGFLEEESLEPGRLVQFTLVRYRAVSVSTTTTSTTTKSSTPSPSSSATSNSRRREEKKTKRRHNRNHQKHSRKQNALHHHPQQNEEDRHQQQPLQNESVGQPQQQQEVQDTGHYDDNNSNHLPTHHHTTVSDIAHSHASNPVPHSELKLGPHPRLSTQDPQPPKKQPPQVRLSSATFSKMLKDTNPILLTTMSYNSNNKNNNDNNQKQDSSSTGNAVSSTYKVRRMEVHPYIAASKDEIWVDPLTGLEYRTDLCDYLGHDRKESGRHTLVGVGQYMRTMLKIKVYGIALYVSKRDALADPTLKQYASFSAEELRNRPDFYTHLRYLSLGGEESDNSSPGMKVDRTLFLKTNMQLSTETMRSSLDADWKLLTDEAKSLLIGTSLEPREADENMLRKIQSPDNPSKCSCAQYAAEEYQADPTCCARGTELGFTWRKNGDLEVRLDGRVMDSFNRPDIAEGIFYEYLRVDDPMSPDFIERVVDGFPFLLAPLAQVKGVNLQQSSSSHNTNNNKASSNGGGSGFGGSVKEAFGDFAETISSQAGELAGNIHSGAMGLAGNTLNTVKSVGDAAKSIGEQMDRRRDLLFKQMSSTFSFSTYGGNAFKYLLAGKYRNALVILTTEEGGDEMEDEDEQDNFNKNKRRHQAPRGRAFRYPLSKWLGETYQAPDEIGPMIHPTMNVTRKIFLGLVHLYLLLLLIVSFPGSYHTRTKIRRHSKSIMLDSESETSDSAGSTTHDDFDWYHKEKFSSTSNRSTYSNPTDRFYHNNNCINRRYKSIRSSSNEKAPEKMKKSLSYFL